MLQLNALSAGIFDSRDFNKLDLYPLCQCFSLRKQIKSPKKGKNVLDQILSNISDLPDESPHLPSIGRYDHQTQFLLPQIRQKMPPLSKKYRQMTPGNLNALCLKMNFENWKKAYSKSDVGEKVSAFNSIVFTVFDEIIPVRSVHVHSTDKPWMTHNIEALIKARQRIFTNRESKKYESLRGKVAKLISNAKRRYYKFKAEGCHKTNPSKWSKSIFQLAGSTEVQRLLSSQNHIDQMEIADRLQKVLSSHGWELDWICESFKI